MRIFLITCVLLTGCGGAVFTPDLFEERPPDAGQGDADPDASAPPDAGVPVDAHGVDALAEGSAADATTPDAAPDAGEDAPADAPPDVQGDAPAEAGCGSWGEACCANFTCTEPYTCTAGQCQ